MLYQCSLAPPLRTAELERTRRSALRKNFFGRTENQTEELSRNFEKAAQLTRIPNGYKPIHPEAISRVDRPVRFTRSHRIFGNFASRIPHILICSYFWVEYHVGAVDSEAIRDARARCKCCLRKRAAYVPPFVQEPSLQCKTTRPGRTIYSWKTYIVLLYSIWWAIFVVFCEGKG